MEKSKNKIKFHYIVLAILFQSISLVMLKIAASSIETFDIISIISNRWYILSFLSLIFQALAWQVVLRKYKLSFAYCFLSLIYIVMLISSAFIFNEKITVNNIFGVILIVVGVIVYSLSHKDRK